MGFQNPIVAGQDLIIPSIHSPNYVEPTTGWRIAKDGNATFQNITTADTISAEVVNADILQQGGLSLDEINAPFDQGLEAWKFNTTVGNQTWAAAGEKIMETTMVLRPGRVYVCNAIGFKMGGTIANDVHEVFLTWTQSVDEFTTPPSPGIGSTRATSASQLFPVPFVGFFLTSANCTGWISNLGTVNIQATVAVCIRRDAGTGQPVTNMIPSFGGRLTVSDGGLNIPDVGQVFAPGGGSGGSTPTTHDVTWFKTGQQGYNEDHTIRNDTSGNANAYQGFFSSQHGDHGGMFFFDSAAIRSALAGATITNVFFWLQNTHWFNNAGGIAIVGIHNTDPPPPPNCPPDLAFGGFVEHNLWNLVVSKGGSAWTGDLGPTLGNRLRDGTVRGLYIGHVGSHAANGYGYFSNAAIRIQYTK